MGDTRPGYLQLVANRADTLKAHQVRTVVLIADGGSCRHIRKAATAQSDVQQIYRASDPPQVVTPKAHMDRSGHVREEREAGRAPDYACRFAAVQAQIS